MKAITRIIAILVVVVMLVNLAGCYGSFSLTRKLYEWNGSLGDKWINTAVMWVLMIIPVYSAAGFIDFWILNTVEFWTDSNPLTMNPGEQKIKYATSDGKTYKFLISKNKMDITETIGPESGKSISLFYSPENGNWIMDDGKDETVIAKMSNDNLTLIYPNKETKNIKPIY